MTQMVRWDPFSEMTSLRRAMDRLFEDYAPTRAWRAGEAAELTFPVDLSENENEVTLKAVLPGIKPEDVEISVSDGVLTIRGEAHQEQTTEKENFYRREIRYGAFSRSIPLPSRVDQEQSEAEFKDGLLTIKLPKAAEARPKTIKVKGGAQQHEGELVGSGNSTG
jgi:HSP20 family protein